MKRTKLNPRKLLVASIGVATIDYIAACGGDAYGVANLMAPPNTPSVGGSRSTLPPTVANLMAPPYGPGGAGGYPPTVANLMAPPSPYPMPSTLPDAGNPQPGQDAAVDAGDVDAG
jgi:hypothetical protein